MGHSLLSWLTYDILEYRHWPGCLIHVECFQAERKTDGVLAAAKIIEVKDESELDDFMVEIDILSECKHKHVVGMYEAYYHENKLWVSSQFI